MLLRFWQELKSVFAISLVLLLPIVYIQKYVLLHGFTSITNYIQMTLKISLDCIGVIKKSLLLFCYHLLKRVQIFKHKYNFLLMRREKLRIKFDKQFALMN